MSIQKQIVKQGFGNVIPPGSNATVHYTGTFLDGTKFDSSRDRGQPFTFNLNGGVIQGWIDGVSTMKQGEICVLIIPPSI